MSPEERQLLATLFDRVRTASATPRDRDAEAFIEQGTREQPYATYYLAQAVIVQEKGLEAAANRIRELEDRVHELEASQSDHHRGEQSGGFLSSIFGSGQSQQSASANAPGPWSGSAPRQNYRAGSDYNDDYRAPPPPAGPWTQQATAPSAGGSFLRGALGTAAGVAGGMLLANSLSSIFSSHTNALGWGSPFAGNNPFGNPEPPVQETVINNNYFGDDAVREASDDNNAGGGGRDGSDGNNDGGWQQADYDDNDQSDQDNGDFDGDDSMNV